jgi:predicted transport protein
VNFKHAKDLIGREVYLMGDGKPAGKIEKIIKDEESGIWYVQTTSYSFLYFNQFVFYREDAQFISSVIQSRHAWVNFKNEIDHIMKKSLFDKNVRHISTHGKQMLKQEIKALRRIYSKMKAQTQGFEYLLKEAEERLEWLNKMD